MEKAPEMIVDWLKTEGRKRYWLAAQVHCADRTLRSWLNGRVTPATVYRVELERVTGLPVKDLEAWK